MIEKLKTILAGGAVIVVVLGVMFIAALPTIAMFKFIFFGV